MMKIFATFASFIQRLLVIPKSKRLQEWNASPAQGRELPSQFGHLEERDATHHVPEAHLLGARLLTATCGGRVIEMQLRSLRANECAELAQIQGDTSPDGENLCTLSGGHPGRLLHILREAVAVSSEQVKATSQEEDEPAPENILEGFTAEETEYLFRAAYLPEATKETLALFCVPRQASLTFNWIKNAGNLSDERPHNYFGIPLHRRGG